MSLSTHSALFTEMLQNRWLTLHHAAEVVQLSHIVRPSITYLDLQISKKMDFKIFLNTEEKCRKFFTPSRRLLYTQHLDLPPGREITLKNDAISYKFNNDSNPYRFNNDPIIRTGSIICIPHIEKITLHSGVEVKILSNFLKEALQIIDCKLKTLENSFMSPHSNYCWHFQQLQFVITNKKMKLLELILKSRLLRRVFLFDVQELCIVDSFIGYFYPDNTDSATFRSFIKNFNIPRYIGMCEKPQVIEFLLRHAHHHGRNLEREGFSMRLLIDYCILKRFFLNVEPILMYSNSPRFSPRAYDWYKSAITALRPDVTGEVIAKMETWLRPERIYLLLQMFWLVRNRSRLPYVKRDYRPVTPDTKCLHWMWSSIPDPLFSLEEVCRAFKGALHKFETCNLFTCYALHVGCFQAWGGPRSLKHLSRIAVRGMLQKTGRYIPEAIRKCEIPNELKEYMNFQRDGDYLEKVQMEYRKIISQTVKTSS